MTNDFVYRPCGHLRSLSSQNIILRVILQHREYWQLKTTQTCYDLTLNDVAIPAQEKNSAFFFNKSPEFEVDIQLKNLF